MQFEGGYVMKEKLLAFFEEYPACFNKFEQQYILGYKREEGTVLPDVIREIYAEIGCLSSKDDLFQGFLDLADEEFSLKGKRVLEIGGGILPQLSKKMLSSFGVSNVVVYDPRLSIYEEEIENFVLKRDYFHSWDDVSHTDLIVSLMPPCQLTETIIDTACQNHIDFMIAMTEGGLFALEDTLYSSISEWQQAMIHLAEESIERENMGVFKQKTLEKYGDSAPVICNSRK